MTANGSLLQFLSCMRSLFFNPFRLFADLHCVLGSKSWDRSTKRSSSTSTTHFTEWPRQGADRYFGATYPCFQASLVAVGDMSAAFQESLRRPLDVKPCINICPTPWKEHRLEAGISRQKRSSIPLLKLDYGQRPMLVGDIRNRTLSFEIQGQGQTCQWSQLQS